MLLLLLAAYDFGGFLCGLSLGVLYIACLFRHRRRSPWSLSLGIGWLLVAAGIVSFMHSQVTRPENYNWLEDLAGFQEIGILFWWVTLFIYLVMRGRQRVVVENQTPHLDQSSDGVWPPPPDKKS